MRELVLIQYLKQVFSQVDTSKLLSREQTVNINLHIQSIFFKITIKKQNQQNAASKINITRNLRLDLLVLNI